MADDRRQQLADEVAAALRTHRGLLLDEIFGRIDLTEIADALLPLLDRVAADAAAEALSAAAAEQMDEIPRLKPNFGSHAGGHECAAEMLRDRAAELRAPARTDEEN